MNFSKLNMVDFQSGDILEYIKSNVLSEEMGEVCYIFGKNPMLNLQKLLALNFEIMEFKIESMDEDDIEDCTNCLVILDGVMMNDEKLNQIIPDSEITFALRDFKDNPLLEEEAQSLLNHLEIYDYEDLNSGLLEGIKPVINSEYSLGKNSSIYYRKVEDNKIATKSKELEIESITSPESSKNIPESIERENVEYEEGKLDNKINGTLHSYEGKTSPHYEESITIEKDEWFKELLGKKLVELKPYDSEVKNLYITRDGKIYQRKNKYIALLLAIFFGMYGGDKFYLKRYGMGALFVLTGGLFLVGWFYSVYKIATSINVYAKTSFETNVEVEPKAEPAIEENQVKPEAKSKESNFDISTPFVIANTIDGLFKIETLVNAQKGIENGIYQKNDHLEAISVINKADLIKRENNMNFMEETILEAKGLSRRTIELCEDYLWLVFHGIAQSTNATLITLQIESADEYIYVIPKENIKIFANDNEVKYTGNDLVLDWKNYDVNMIKLELESINVKDLKKLIVEIKSGYAVGNFIDTTFIEEFNF